MNEVTDGDELIRQDLSLIFEVMNKLAAFFVKEKAIGRLAKRADSEHLADFCAAIHGAMLMGRVEATVQETLREGVVNLQIIGRLFFAKVVRWWLLAGIVFIGSCAVADAVTEWNERALACALTAKQPSTAAVRTLAMVHVAMFEAVNSVEHGYAPYKVKVSAPSGSSAEAAAIAAAHTVLVKLFRDQGKDLDAAYTASLAVVPDGSAKESGVAVGEKVAGEIISLRANDGADAPNQYRPVTAPGVYVVTTLPAGSQLPGVTPWLMERASQFRPGPPPPLTSREWDRDYNELKDWGGKESTLRTAEQTEIGRFWGILGPPCWDPIVRELAAAPGRTLLQNARLFALVEMAAADSYIAVFDAKYTYNFWRPITAIRNGDLDGNDETVRVADWEPLIETPLHPEYPCAHCINSGAVAAVLESEFGNGPTPGLNMTSSALPGVVRRWSSISEWADEMALARIYGGVHYRNSIGVGKAMGKSIGQLAVSSYLKPVR